MKQMLKLIELQKYCIHKVEIKSSTNVKSRNKICLNDTSKNKVVSDL